MKTLNVMLSDLDGKILPLGYEGENLYTCVRINCVQVFSEYPDAVVSMVVQPPVGDMYPAVVEKSGVMVVWDITDSVLSSSGQGQVQLTFTNDEIIRKSVIFGISINSSLVANGEAPEPVQEWIDSANETAHQIAHDAAMEAAEEVIESIPEDYTEMSEDVSNLKSALSSVYAYSGAIKKLEGYAISEYYKQVRTNQGSYSIWFQTEPNTTYFINRSIVTQRFLVASTETTPAANVATSQIIRNDSASSIEITTKGTDHFVVAMVLNASVDTEYTWDQIYNSISVYTLSANDRIARAEFTSLSPVVLRNKTVVDSYLTKDISFDGAVFGKWISNTGAITSGNNDFKYTQPIAVKAHQLIAFTGAGYSTTVSMISEYDSDNNTYTPLVISTNSNVNEYTYIAEKDMLVVFSYNTKKTHEGQISIDYKSMAFDADVQFITESCIVRLAPTIINGSFIGADGAVNSSASFFITEPVFIPRNSRLFVYARGYRTQVSVISRVDSSKIKYVPKVVSTDTETKTYVFDVTESGYYAFSGNSSVRLNAYYVSHANNDTSISLSMFERIGVVGDSFASGVIFSNNQTSYTKYNLSWGQEIARRNGIICTNYSKGGLSTRTWLTDDHGLTLMLANTPEDMYLLVLGINDYYGLGEDYLGTLSDITDFESYSDYRDTFYGNYGKIIEQIQGHAPNAKLIIFTVANTSTVPQKFSDAIIRIALHYGIPYIIQADDEYFQSREYTAMIGGHPTAVGYAGMASTFERLISDAIKDNYYYFWKYKAY